MERTKKWGETKIVFLQTGEAKAKRLYGWSSSSHKGYRVNIDCTLNPNMWETGGDS